MKTIKSIITNGYRKLLYSWLGTISLMVFIFTGVLMGWQPQAVAFLAQGNAITDPNAILRYSLPIDNDNIRQLQDDLEDLSEQLRSKRWSTISKDLKDANLILNYRRDDILESIPEQLHPQSEILMDKIADGIEVIQDLVDDQDRDSIYPIKEEILGYVGDLEESMITEFPYEVPEEYAHLPQLLGRAVVELETTKGNIDIVVDGYSAPVNGGNFVDLVQRGFYDGLSFDRAEVNFLQAGDPPGPTAGFIDPQTEEYRAVPLEVLVSGDDEPTYEYTLEQLGRYLDVPIIPFNAYGAVALAHPGFNPNGGSSQFFFFKFDTELTPPGFNLMDGRYSVFGYTVKGKDVIDELTTSDKIISAKVVHGLENLVQPS
ncbi:MAG: peptidylprolyl isomerase [Xenococcus sp. (in: cyanobacteria)]